jgi:uncharacterized protein YigE (DUF2233 family)
VNHRVHRLQSRSRTRVVLATLILGGFTSIGAYSQEAYSATRPLDKIAVFRPPFQRIKNQAGCVVVRFRDVDFELVVIDNGPRRGEVRFRNLSVALEQNKCIAGTNGGFFDVTTFRPNGLMISDGRGTGTFDSKNWAAGILAVRNRKLHLVDQSQFAPDVSVTQMVQTGPWLVRDGKAQSGFTNDQSPARRTFVATDGAGAWVLGHLESSTLLELAIFLTSPPIKEIIPVREALNLDGGSSSGLWVADGNTPTYFPEKTIVRNFVGITPRNADRGR